MEKRVCITKRGLRTGEGDDFALAIGSAIALCYEFIDWDHEFVTDEIIKFQNVNDETVLTIDITEKAEGLELLMIESA